MTAAAIVHRRRDPDAGYSSLKILVSDKSALERLQARLVTETGEKISLHELVGRAIALAVQDPEAIIDASPVGLDEKRWQGFLASLPPKGTGPITSEETIDQDLLRYFEEKPRLPPREGEK